MGGRDPPHIRSLPPSTRSLLPRDMQTIPGVALVTGGSSGIGRASAIALARAGWQVCIAGRREDELLETVRLSSLGEGKEMLSVPADLTKVEEVDGLFKKVVDKFGESRYYSRMGPSADAVLQDDWTCSSTLV